MKNTPLHSADVGGKVAEWEVIGLSWMRQEILNSMIVAHEAAE